MEIEIPTLRANNALNFIKELEEYKVEDDVSFKVNMRWVTPFGMLITICAMRQFREKFINIPFKMVYTDYNDGMSYAAHMGFFKSISDKIDLGKGPGEANGSENYIPISPIDFGALQKEKLEKGDIVTQEEIIDRESSNLSKLLCRDNNEIYYLLSFLIREILRNIPEHAETNKAWVCGQYYPNDSTAEIAIVDEGIGIKSSLTKNMIHKKNISSDEDALDWSIKAGISSSFNPSRMNSTKETWENSGFGLYMVSEICKELNGIFYLASGKKYLKTNKVETCINDTEFNGTAIGITISTKYLNKSKDIIAKISSQGEEQAKTICNAFKKASSSSKGIIKF